MSTSAAWARAHAGPGRRHADGSGQRRRGPGSQHHPPRPDRERRDHHGRRVGGVWIRAISGVVNLKLKREFEGVELSGRWGQTDRHDGEQYDLALTAGTSFAESRGRVIGFVGHSSREQIDRVARDFAVVDLLYKGWIDAPEGEIGPDNDFFAARNAFIEEGLVGGVNADKKVFESLFEESYGYAVCGSPTESDDCVPYQQTFGFNTDGTLFTTGNNAPGSVANFKGEIDPVLENGGRFYGYNTAPFYALQLPLERTSLFLVGSFDLNEVIDVYAQGLYTDYTANTQVSPVPLMDVTMPVSNPFIPPDLKRLLDARPPDDRAAPVDFAKRMTEIGPRIQEEPVRHVPGHRRRAWHGSRRLELRCLRAARRERPDDEAVRRRAPLEGRGADLRPGRWAIALRRRLQSVWYWRAVRRMRRLCLGQLRVHGKYPADRRRGVGGRQSADAAGWRPGNRAWRHVSRRELPVPRR